MDIDLLTLIWGCFNLLAGLVLLLLYNYDRVRHMGKALMRRLRGSK